jgi:hypothetical protein
MAETSRSSPVVREAVASFPDRAHFRRAVSALLAAGFERTDLSVLATHESLAAATGTAPEIVPAGLSDELDYIDPLAAAGIILLSGGPIAATVAALIAAGLGATALKEIFDLYTAPRHRKDFAAALKAGAALLWVRVDDPEHEQTATRILTQTGGQHVHIHARAPQGEGKEG